MGSAYDALDRHADAITAHKKAVAIKPDDDSARLFIGHAYYALKEYTKAITSYKESIAIKPNYAMAQFWSARFSYSVPSCSFSNALASCNRRWRSAAFRALLRSPFSLPSSLSIVLVDFLPVYAV